MAGTLYHHEQLIELRVVKREVVKREWGEMLLSLSFVGDWRRYES